MKLDRLAFLATTSALWTAACPSEPGVAPPVVAAVDIPTKGGESPSDAGRAGSGPDASTPPLAVPPPPRAPDDAPPADGTCAADMNGTLAVCAQWRVDPTCESAGEQIRECRTLYEAGPYGGFKPRVAQAVAECWANQPVKRPACKVNKGRCIRAAVDTACVDPAMQKKCDDLLAECQRKGKRVKYTREQCEKILSSVVGQAQRDAMDALAPMNEGCVLDYVLPYYPYNRQWWP